MAFPGLCVASEYRPQRGWGRSLGYFKARTTTVRAALKEAGTEEDTGHCNRPTFASRLVMAEV